MKKLPETCATCRWSWKDLYPWWECWAGADGTGFLSGGKKIPCARGKLPSLPRWCPLRGERHDSDNRTNRRALSPVST